MTVRGRMRSNLSLVQRIPSLPTFFRQKRSKHRERRLEPHWLGVVATSTSTSTSSHQGTCSSSLDNIRAVDAVVALVALVVVVVGRKEG
eukprot:scaffold1815_cov208-Amphora_coffeaeformis.AAC.5